MKRYIRSNTTIKGEDILNLLKSHNIDTTTNQYELVAEEYERYEQGGRYKKTFKCPGDYLAFFSMALHANPTPAAIEDYYGDLDELEYYVNKYPTLSDIGKYASQNWYGDGADHIISLKNLTTGELLYSDGVSDEYIEDEGDWE